MPTTLLGHLAQFNAFYEQGELLCTQGLAYIFQTHPEASRIFLEKISKQTNVVLPTQVEWQSEARQSDGGRPDLEARAGKAVVLKIEAKLGAALGDSQLNSYAKHLQQANRDTVLVILGPRWRLNELNGIVAEVFNVTPTGQERPDAYPNVQLEVMAWEDMFTLLEKDATDDRFALELEQLRDLYHTLRQDEIQPLASTEVLLRWREGEQTFRPLIDRLTRELTISHKLFPLQVEASGQELNGLAPSGYRRRYVGRSHEKDMSYFSIGIRDPFANSNTPVWLRFHVDTYRFEDIKYRIEQSDLASKSVTSEGHLWLPLEVPIGLGGDELVANVRAQAERIVAIGLGKDRDSFGARTSASVAEDGSPSESAAQSGEVVEAEPDAHLCELVNRLTRELTTHHKLLPFAPERPQPENPETGQSLAYRRRYVGRPLREDLPYFCVGVCSETRGQSTQIWARFHHDTPEFDSIESRLLLSPLAPRVTKRQGHTWIPLYIVPDASHDTKLYALREQMADIIRIAYAN